MGFLKTPKMEMPQAPPPPTPPPVLAPASTKPGKKSSMPTFLGPMSLPSFALSSETQGKTLLGQ